MRIIARVKSKFAGNERRGSSNSRDSFNSRASVSTLAIAVVRGRAVFDLLRRFPAAALPPALERRRIASPRGSGQGIVPVQTSTLEAAGGGLVRHSKF